MSLTIDIPLVMKSTKCMVQYIHALYGAPCPFVYCATFSLHFTHLAAGNRRACCKRLNVQCC